MNGHLSLKLIKCNSSVHFLLCLPPISNTVVPSTSQQVNYCQFILSAFQTFSFYFLADLQGREKYRALLCYMSYLQGHSNLSVWKARKWLYQINPGKQTKDIHLRIDYNFFLCDFCRSGSRTRTRCPFYWAHLRRRLSSSSRNATGAVIRT